MKIILVHKLPESDPYEGIAWYGWYDLNEYFDDNVADFKGRTREEAIENARSIQEDYPAWKDHRPNCEIEMVDVDSP